MYVISPFVTIVSLDQLSSTPDKQRGGWRESAPWRPGADSAPRRQRRAREPRDTGTTPGRAEPARDTGERPGEVPSPAADGVGGAWCELHRPGRAVGAPMGPGAVVQRDPLFCPHWLPATPPPPGSALGAGPPCAPHPPQQHPEAGRSFPELTEDNLRVQDQQSFTTDITNVHNTLAWLHTTDGKDTVPDVPDTPNSTASSASSPTSCSMGQREGDCSEDRVGAAMLGDANPSWSGVAMSPLLHPWGSPEGWPRGSPEGSPTTNILPCRLSSSVCRTCCPDEANQPSNRTQKSLDGDPAALGVLRLPRSPAQRRGGPRWDGGGGTGTLTLSHLIGAGVTSYKLQIMN
ncbi:uncharacterized protein LOC141915953 [Strix aluco]|uniref:uncharacterized protein LOC141915953 n=1 Tax=Strix aluco TaxID=111821 RepID=UPI003DA68BC1